ncbi:hypothetical protein PAHAL_1G387500 [Panicum hallii]|uniref:Uncharacterized protein n=1 Tax=Panicum hallii TaxID=206008 RepID=A0A2T8KXM5_9POAL|nr:hypothetical protein PAHAL_1G387500 [Panicum hallii]
MVTTGACVPPGLLRLRPCEVCSFSDLGSRLWRRLATDPECRDTGRLPVRSMLQVCSYLLTAPPILASKTVVTSFAWVSASIFLLGDSLSSMAMEEY